MTMNDAAALLARMRKRKGVSMSTLSAVAGIPVSTISRIEAGKVEPTWSTMRRLSAAAGYDITTDLKDSGGDEPLAGIIDCLEKAAPEKRASVVARFPMVALLAPVAFRAGARMVERTGSLGGLCRDLEEAGQRPAISSFEAFVGETERFSSVFSVVYVDDPATVDGLTDCVGWVGSAVYLLRRSERSSKHETLIGKTRAMSPEWAILDSLGSPGRQSDLTMHLLEELEPTVRL
jgi:transcriptional regulator with XRE-family HTH domain